MKNLFKYLLITTLVVAFSCNESDDIVTANAREGGLLEPTATSLNYVVGQPEGPYTIELFVRQGKLKTRQINLYKSFVKTEKYTVEENGEEVEKSSTFTSNEVLAKTIDITENTNHFVTTSFTFDDLIEGLEIGSVNDGIAPLPANDGDYNIGDRWVFRIESVIEDGFVARQAAPVNVSVSTRYAGIYKAIAAEYNRNAGGSWDSPADLSGWPDETVIESVDATTYRVVEWLGPFDGNEFFFQIDPNTGKITYPAKKPTGEDQTGNDLPFITCEANGGDMPNDKSHCDNSNYVINDDVNGKDRLVMTFGYMGANGPRIFYQVLEKIVD